MVSLGNAAMPPISTSVMNGIQPQMSAITQTAKARVGSDSHATSANGGKMSPKNASNNPNSGLNMKRKDTPTNAGLIENGRISSVRTVNRRRPPGASSKAIPSASNVVSPTVNTV